MRCRQQGFSLVSLMVGLTLSMITVVALMMAYKALGRGSLNMVANTKWESQGAGLSVALPRLLQQAGWGAGAAATPQPGGAVNTDVVLLSTSALSGTTLTGTASAITSAAQAGSALVWSTAVTGTIECWALVASHGGVALLGPAACTAASDWSTLGWTERVDLAPAGSFVSVNSLPAFEIQAIKGMCWPYGGNGSGGQPAVVITLIQRHERTTVGVNPADIGNDPRQTNTVCLSNIPN